MRPAGDFVDQRLQAPSLAPRQHVRAWPARAGREAERQKGTEAQRHRGRVALLAPVPRAWLLKLKLDRDASDDGMYGALGTRKKGLTTYLEWLVHTCRLHSMWSPSYPRLLEGCFVPRAAREAERPTRMPLTAERIPSGKLVCPCMHGHKESVQCSPACLVQSRRLAASTFGVGGKAALGAIAARTHHQR